MNKLGIYIHVPFCLKKCGYCDFYSVCDMSARREYTERLIRDIYSKSEMARDCAVDTIYFGGGTPSLLSCRDFEDITDALRKSFSIEKDAEFTVEVNPATVDMKKTQTYAKCGVNRVSIGMQTRDKKELEVIGRIHTNEDFDNTVAFIRKAGIDNISVDVMYALPSQRENTLSATLDYVISQNFSHVSTYCLKLEQGTPMYESGVLQPSEEEQFSMYSLISDKLVSAGYEHYEISNFAKPGFASRHNMRYWRMEEYLGFGPGAYSYFGGSRFGVDKDISAYIEGKERIVDIDTVDGKTYDFERIMLGLRLSYGVELNILEPEKVKMLVDGGYGKLDSGRFSLTKKGFFVSNEIICFLTD